VFSAFVFGVRLVMGFFPEKYSSSGQVPEKKEKRLEIITADFTGRMPFFSSNQ